MYAAVSQAHTLPNVLQCARIQATAVLYFLRRGADAIACETRLDPDGPGFQLVITQNATERIENFTELRDLLAREHDLLQAWRAQGWRDAGQPSPTPPDSWSGP
jgi:hypothetical protein